MRAITNHLALVLVRSIAEARSRLGVAGSSGGIVLHGAPGAGKTSLALAAARNLRCDRNFFALVCITSLSPFLVLTYCSSELEGCHGVTVALVDRLLRYNDYHGETVIRV